MGPRGFGCAGLSDLSSAPEAAVNPHARNVRTAAAVAFLQRLDLTGRHHLTALHPETGEIESRNFAPGSWADIAAWIEARAHLNLYYSVNEPFPDAPHSKLRKEHIARIRAIVADLDLEGGTAVEVREQRAGLMALAKELSEGEHPPSYTVDSGNGVQLVWPLAVKLDAKVYRIDAEDLGAGIARQLDGDSVQNIDRIMRIPGGYNHSAPKKRARGLEGGPVRILEAYSNPDAVYTIEELEQSYEPIAGTDQKDRDAAVQAAMDEVDWNTAEAGVSEALAARLRAAAEVDPYFKGLLAGSLPRAPGDGSGSDWRAALAGAMARKGFGLNDYAAAAYAYPPGQPRDGGSVTLRMVARDWARVGQAALAAAPKPETMFAPIEAEPDTSSFPAPVPETYELGGPTTERQPLELVSFAEAVERARSSGRRPLIKGLLDQGAMTVLYGDSNVGKTFVALLIAYHIAMGLAFAGMKTTRVRVVYIAAEGGEGVTRRAAALAKVLGPAVDFDFVLSPVNLLDPAADLRPLIALIRSREGVGFSVLDTLSRAMAGGDENASTDMGALVKNLDILRKETTAHLMVVHHTGKDAARGARGHSLLRAATDTEIEVSEGQIAVTKQRDLTKSWASPFALRNVELWKDEDGDLVTSAVAELVASKADVPPGLATAKEREVLDALAVCSETSEDDRGGVKVDEIVSVLDGSTSKGTVRTLLLNLQAKRLVVKIDRGLWRPTGGPAAGPTAGPLDPEGMFEVIPDTDKLSETDLFD